MSRVLIVDDHPGFRRVARGQLQAEGLDVIGEAVDEASAVAADELSAAALAQVAA